jgi:hypothetical protein
MRILNAFFLSPRVSRAPSISSLIWIADTLHCICSKAIFCIYLLRMNLNMKLVSAHEQSRQKAASSYLFTCTDRRKEKHWNITEISTLRLALILYRLNIFYSLQGFCRHDPTWGRTRAAGVKSQYLTVWAMACH